MDNQKQFEECVLIPKKEYERLKSKRKQEGEHLLPFDELSGDEIKSKQSFYSAETSRSLNIFKELRQLEDVLNQVMIGGKSPPTGYTLGRLLNLYGIKKAKLQNLLLNQHKNKNRKTLARNNVVLEHEQC